MGKKWNPLITNKIVKKIEEDIMWGSLEGSNHEVLWKVSKEFSNWYHIAINGKVINKNGKELEYMFKKSNQDIPYVKIYIWKSWEWKKQYKEYNVLSLIRQYYWAFISWYQNTQKICNQDKTFFLVRRNNNETYPFSLENLQYIEKSEYNKRERSKEMIKVLLWFSKWSRSDARIWEIMNVTPSRVNRIRSELTLKWDLKEKHGNIKKLGIRNIWDETKPIYDALLECNGDLSNLSIAKKLRPDIDYSNKEKKEEMTDKVVRVRKRLVDTNAINTYNTYGKEKNIKEAKDKLKEILIENYTLEKDQRKTSLQIAETLDLDKGQVDNFARSVRAELKAKKELEDNK